MSLRPLRQPVLVVLCIAMLLGAVATVFAAVPTPPCHEVTTKADCTRFQQQD